MDKNQEVFVEGRSLIHNVLICHDLLRYYSRKISLRYLMKIDLRKAYDMVSWDFIEEALNGFGFLRSFTQLIMTYVTSTKFTVKVNGEGFGFFEGRKGLRQGDPLSPLLFVLVLPDFRYYHSCKFTKLTHLIFADGLLQRKFSIYKQNDGSTKPP